ncbi:MAG: glycosyltransferase [Undibacterium sp.]|uniref:glycosyltransferase n=1 Tax=Undibacterium sp. TaxID=1914977 RepID=UPI00271631C4|nr:glycosyltransferase [Undibacterium sp.]MDO8652466.1 glycosyltransferase [Undibacterium sp.]
MLAPIVLFAYARPDHVRRTVESLSCNPGASDHELIVFSDAARTPDKQSAVDQVRGYLESIKGFRSVTIYHRPHNFGLAKSVISGVTQVLVEHERVIVVEDDLLTSPHFLAYMNDALDRFADDERVISIHGYVYPVQRTLPEAFFLPGADCWGWATWRRGWGIFSADGQALLDELKRRDLLKEFDFNGTYGYSKMLEGQIKGLNNSWAVRWYASAFLAGKLTLYPGRSLVHNIGNDGSGTHCGDGSSLNAILSATTINLSALEVVPSAPGQAAFESFFRKSQGTLVGRLGRRIRRLFSG